MLGNGRSFCADLPAAVRSVLWKTICVQLVVVVVEDERQSDEINFKPTYLSFSFGVLQYMCRNVLFYIKSESLASGKIEAPSTAYLRSTTLSL